MTPLCSDQSIWEFDSFKTLAPAVTAFTTSRHGGFSEGNYASFNPSPYSGDDLQSVEKNLDKLKSSLPQRPEYLIRPRQVHKVVVRPINKDFLKLAPVWQNKCLEGVDALMTNVPGCCICVSTADCIPVLIYDKVHQVVAAIHAGWRGTVKRIVVHVLHQMQQLYGTKGEDIYAAIGPGISLKAFEVGDEVYEEFEKAAFDMDKISYLDEPTQKYHIDLWKANTIQLEDCHVSSSHIEVSEICTYTQHEDFFSARRLGIQSGRILTGIMINK